MSEKLVKHQYLAFISYRHADNKQTGRQWATWLHQAIETYEIPKDLVGQKNARGELIPERIFPIFRDEEELPADADLGNAITRALDNTQLLIVLCSPNAVASTYVADEIDYFKKLGRSDQIIAAMIDGEPNASWDKTKQSQGVAPEEECFPKPLQYAYDAQGNPTTQLAEPLAADFRVNHDGKLEQGWTSIEAYKQYLKSRTEFSSQDLARYVEQYQAQQKLMLLKIIAGILGVPLGALTKRDQAYQLELAKQKAKRLRQWLSAVAMLAVIAVVAGVFAYIKQQQAIKNEQLAQQQTKIATEQRDASLLNQSRFLLDRARQANDDGEHDTALLLGLNALPGLYGGERPMPGGIGQLRRAIYANNKHFYYQAQEKIEQYQYVENEQLFVLSNGKVKRLSITDSDEDKLLKTEQFVQGFSLSRDNKQLAIATREGEVSVWDSDTLTKQQSTEIKAEIKNLVFSPDNKILYMSSHFDRLIAWDVTNNELLYDVKHSQQYGLVDIQISPNGHYILTTPELVGPLKLFNAQNGNEIRSLDLAYDFTAKNSLARQTGFTNDSQGLVIYDLNGTRVEAVESGEQQGVTPHIHTLMSKNGEYVYAMATVNQVQSTTENADFIRSLEKAPTLWNIKTNQGSQLSHFSNVEDGAFTPDGKLLITLAYKNVRVWDVATAIEVNNFKINQRTKLVLTNSELVNASSDDKSISIWSLLKNSPSIALSEKINLWGAEFSTDGHTLAAQSLDNKNQLYMFNSLSGELVRRIDLCERHRVNIADVANAKRFISVECGYGNHQVFDLEKNSLIEFGDKYDSSSVVLLNEAQHFVLFIEDSWNKKALYLVDLMSEQSIAEIPLSEDTIMTEPRLSADGRYLLLGNNKKGVMLYDLQAKKPQFNTTKIARVLDAYFVSQANRLVIKAAKRKVGILDLQTGEVLKQLTFQSDIADLLVKGSELVIGLKDKAVVVVDTVSLQELYRFNTTEEAGDLSLSASAEYLIINQGKPSIYHLDTGQLFYQVDDYQQQQIAFDEHADRLIILANQGKLFSLPALSREINDAAKNALPKRRNCLTQKQREDNFISPLNVQQKQARGCLK